MNLLDEQAASPVVGVIILVAIAVILSTIAFAGVSVFFEEPEPATAGVTADYESESTINVQLNSIQSADKVIIQSPLGTEYTLNKVGDNAKMLNTEPGGTVIAVKDGERTVIRHVEPHSFTTDITVDADGTEDYETISAAIDAASPGDTIVVEKATYSVDSLTIDKDVTIVGEYGTEIVDSSLSDTSDSTVMITADGAKLSNFNIDANGETNGVTVSANNVRAASFDVKDASSGDLSNIGSNNKIIKSTNQLISPPKKSSTSIAPKCLPSDSYDNKGFSSWTSETTVSISNPNSKCLKDYQVKVTVPKLSGMNSDYSDIRFTQTVNGETKTLPYWIQKKGTNSAVVWVKVASIPKDGATIKLDYGNSGATSASNGEKTFEIFDDFNRANFGPNYATDQSTSGGKFAIENGVAQVFASQQTYYDGHRWRLTYTGKKLKPSYDVHARYHEKQITGGNEHERSQNLASRIFVHADSTTAKTSGYLAAENQYFETGSSLIFGTDISSVEESTPVDGRYWNAVTYDVTQSKFTYTEQQDGASKTLSTSVSLQDKKQYPFVGSSYSGYWGSSKLYIDWWFTTKNADEEPTATVNT